MRDMDVGSYIMGEPKKTTKRKVTRKAKSPRNQVQDVTKFALDVAELSIATTATLSMASALKNVVT